MKRLSLAVAATMFAAGTMFISCSSPEKKVEDAKEEVKDAKENLKDVQKDAAVETEKTASAEEWKAFRESAKMKIAENETAIADLRKKMKKTGTEMDKMYTKSIDDLELRNKDLSVKMENYEKNQSGWDSFKREFNHDMDGLGQALKDIVVNNKK